MTQHFAAALISLLVLSSFSWAQQGTNSETSTLRLHCIDGKTPAGLRDLFHYNGDAMPLLSAHRGGPVPGYPENCIETFEHTIRHSYALLEIDLQYTKDGEIVLHHDRTLDRTTTGTGLVRDLTLAELKQLRLKDREGNVTEFVMPTLGEALAWAKGKTILVLDKKEVPVTACVEQIEAHNAEAHAMVLAYSFDDVRSCFQQNDQIMMEVILGNRDRFDQFEKLEVPWSHVVVFISHSPPQDVELLEMIHSKGAYCMAGTSRNLDRQLSSATEDETKALEPEYRALLRSGVDLIETDLPIQLSHLLYRDARIPAAKSGYLRLR